MVALQQPEIWESAMRHTKEIFPIEEFLLHARHSSEFMNYEHVTVRGAIVDFPQEPSVGSMRWLYDEYLKDSGYTAEERAFKVPLFCSIYEYIGGHEEFFRKKGLIKESGDSPFPRIAEDLFRAVHWFATAKRTRLTGESVKPGAVLDLAKAFRNARSVLKHREE
jgi:hypothetical protein